MAFCASSGEPIVTNPKPRGRPLVRSTIRFASTTVPWAAKASCRSFSVVLNDRFPTNSFALTGFFFVPRLSLLAPNCSRLSGFKSSLNSVQLKIYHVLEATSYLTDGPKIIPSSGKSKPLFRDWETGKRVTKRRLLFEANPSSSEGLRGGSAAPQADRVLAEIR